ncbi:hypothetical protein ElyMa_001813000 [Elysia marginata]|uniref:Uncharacterized protein n=1 Tax=Elysia marginata TaxID=1093978 RepID=A0AAV4EIG0_9GAST|nr:hypothetical protein ElyMa_001813000 [Elysia marginata]
MDYRLDGGGVGELGGVASSSSSASFSATTTAATTTTTSATAPTAVPGGGGSSSYNSQYHQRQQQQHLGSVGGAASAMPGVSSAGRDKVRSDTIRIALLKYKRNFVCVSNIPDRGT